MMASGQCRHGEVGGGGGVGGGGVLLLGLKGKGMLTKAI